MRGREGWSGREKVCWLTCFFYAAAAAAAVAAINPVSCRCGGLGLDESLFSVESKQWSLAVGWFGTLSTAKLLWVENR